MLAYPRAIATAQHQTARAALASRHPFAEDGCVSIFSWSRRSMF
jgi:hypothetical protein